MSDAPDLVEQLEAEFRVLDARCSDLLASWPSSMAIYRGEAEITEEQRAEFKAVDDERMDVLLRLNAARRAKQEAVGS